MARQIKSIAAVLIALCCLLLGVAMAADEHAKDRDQILQLEREWNHVYLVNDAAALEHIVADDYLGTTTDGRRVTKTDLIAEVKGPSIFASTHINENDVTIRYYGVTAIVNGSESWVQKNGKSGRYIWTDIFVTRNGRWWVVASQDLEVAESK